MKDWISGIAILLGTALLGVIAYDLLSYANRPNISAVLGIPAAVTGLALSSIFTIIILSLPEVIGKGLRTWRGYK